MTAATQSPRLPQLADQLIAHAPTWILGLLFMLLCARAALLVVDVIEPQAVEADTTAVLPTAAARKVVDLPSILRANLFGQSATPTGTDAPVTTMDLKLPLVFAATDEKRGFAGIGRTATDVKVYQVGDEVPGGARLHAVYVDRVLLDRGGSIEALLVQVREGAPPAPPPPATANPSVAAERVQTVLRDNPSLINQIMSRQAVLANGRVRGIRVNPGPNAQAFNKLGLRPNDIVIAINGTPLDDQARSNEIFNSLNSAPQARVTVVRNDREQELTLNLAEIANEAERLNDAPPTPPGDAEPGAESTR